MWRPKRGLLTGACRFSAHCCHRGYFGRMCSCSGIFTERSPRGARRARGGLGMCLFTGRRWEAGRARVHYLAWKTDSLRNEPVYLCLGPVRGVCSLVTGEKKAAGSSLPGGDFYLASSFMGHNIR